MELMNMLSAEAAIGSAGPALCGVCGQSFSSTSELQEHKVIHKRERPFECSFCDMRYRNYYDFHCHLKTLHSKRSFRLKIGEIQYSNDGNNVKNVTDNPVDAEIHCRVDKIYQKYQCTFCSETFIEQHHLVEHVKQHISDIYNCEFCGKRFTHVELLHGHIKRMHRYSVLNRKVEMPPESSNVETHVDEAVNAHPPTETDPILNATIVKVTDTGSILMAVMNDDENMDDVYEGIEVANANKIFPCTMCNKTFKGKSNHEEHMLTHTGEKPFACVLCDVRFRQRSAISRHLRALHKEYKGPTYKAIRKVSDSTPAVDIGGSHSESILVNTETIQRGSTYQGYSVSETGVIINLGDKSAVDRGKLSQAGGRSVIETTRFIGTGNKSVVSQGELIHAEGRSVIETGQFTGLSDRSLASHGELINAGVKSVIETTRFIDTGEKSVAYPRELAHADTPVVQTERFVNNDGRSAVEMDRLVDTGVSEMDNEDDDMGYGLHGHTVEINTMPQCTVCNKAFPYKSLLQEHMLIHSGENPYACVVCEMRFTHRDTIDQHMRTVHGHLGNQAPSKPLSSESTGAKRIRERYTFSEGVFEKKQTIIKWIDSEDHPYVKSEKRGGARLRRNENEKKEKSHSSKIWQCSVCGEVRSSGIRKHMLMHTSEVPSECDICGKQFKLDRYRKDHMRRIHKIFSSQETESRVKGYKNEISKSDISTYPDDLSAKQCSRIEQRKRRVQKIQCPVCSKIMNKTNYPVHQRKYCTTSKMPYRCDVCLRGFKSLNSLKFHKTFLHTACPVHGKDGTPSCEGNKEISPVEQNALSEAGEIVSINDTPVVGTENKASKCTCRWKKETTYRKFPCPYCSKTFTQRYGLQRHIVCHTRMEPYKCEYCDMTFRLLSSRRTHMGRVHNVYKYECKVCGQNCRNEIRLHIHMKSHSSEKRYKCDYCEYSYKASKTLWVHIRRVHKGCPLPEKRRLMRRRANYVVLESAKTSTERVLTTDESSESLCVSTNNDEALKSNQGEDIENGDTVKCTFCSKTFHAVRYLKEHLRTHTGEKLFKCALCDMRFTFQTSVCRHVRTVHKQFGTSTMGESVKRKFNREKIGTDLSYGCTVCSKTFSTKHKFDYHVCFDSRNGSYKCTLCQDNLKSSSTLRAHMKKMHGGRPAKPGTTKGLSAGSQAVSGESEEEKFAEEILLKELTIRLRRCYSPGYPGAESGNIVDISVAHSKQLTSPHTACTVSQTDLNDHSDETGSTDCTVINFETDPKKHIEDCPVAETEDFGNDIHSVTVEADVSCVEESSKLCEQDNEDDRVTELFQCTICNKIVSQHRLLDEHMLVHTAEQSNVGETLEQNRVEKIVMDNESVGMQMNFGICLKSEPEDVEDSNVIVTQYVAATDNVKFECKDKVDKESVTLSANDTTSSTNQVIHSREGQVPTICQTGVAAVFPKPVVCKVFRCKLCSQTFSYKSLLQRHVFKKHKGVPSCVPSLESTESSAVGGDVEIANGMIDSQSGVGSVKTDHLCTDRDSTDKGSVDLAHKDGPSDIESEFNGSSHNIDNGSVNLSQHDCVAMSCQQKNDRSGVKQGRDETQHLFKGSVVLKENEDGSLRYEKSPDASSNTTIYSCAICNKTLGYRRQFQEHVMTHTGEKPYKCDFCDLHFIRQRGCTSHMQRVHAKCSTAGQIAWISEDICDEFQQCAYCDKSFVLFSSLRSHVKMQHRGCPLPEKTLNQQNDNHNSPQCVYCGRRFTLISSYRRHLRIKHKGCPETSSSRNGNLRPEGSYIPNKRDGLSGDKPNICKVFRCKLCSAIFFEKSLLRSHISKRHKGGAPSVASTESSTVHGDMKVGKSHINKGSVDLAQKDGVTMTRKQGNCRSGIKKEKDGERPYKCDFCDKRFIRQRGCIRHMSSVHTKRRTVHGQSDHIGSEEGLSANGEEEDDDEREIKGTAVKGHRCRVCRKDFVEKSKLIEHANVHTGETQQCVYCGKGFVLFSSYQRHVKQKHTRYPMPSKPRSLRKSERVGSEDLLANEHSLIQADQSSHQCIHCGKRFVRFSCLRKHIKNFHKGHPLPTRHPKKRKDYRVVIDTPKSDLSANDCEASECKEGGKVEDTALYRHFCIVCGKGFIEKCEASEHITIHTDGTPRYCVYCGKRFAFLSSHMRHVKTVHSELPVPTSLIQKTYSCPVCGKSISKKHFSSHMLTHSSDSVVACLDKPAGSKNLSTSGGQHQKGMRKVRIVFDCIFCPKTFTQKRPFLEHVRSHTGDRPHKCNYCGKSFNYYRNVTRHIRVMHMRGSKPSMSRKSNKLYAFDGENSVEGGLERTDGSSTDLEKNCEGGPNIKRDKMGGNDSGELSADFGETRNNQQSEDGFKCTVCSKTFRSKEYLRGHMACHTVHAGKKPYKCLLCEKRFNFQTSASRHVKIVHKGCDEKDIGKFKSTSNETGEESEVYKCFFCEENFYNYGKRYRHMRKFHPGQVVPEKTPTMSLCSVCGYMCPAESKLKIHMLKHTGEKPHECEFCHLKFKIRSSLQKHLQSRELHGACQPKKKNNAFKCPVCDKVFPYYSEDRFEKHMRQHTGETPYKCDFCHVRFRYESSIKQHLKSRTLRGSCPKSFLYLSEKKFTCQICNKRFVTKRSIDDHMSIHTGEKPYGCDYCASRFRCATTLRVHIKTAHKGCPSRVSGKKKFNLEENVDGNHMSESVVNTNKFVDNSRFDSGHHPGVEPMEYDDGGDEGPDLWNEHGDGAPQLTAYLPVSQGQLANFTLEKENTSTHVPFGQGQVTNLTLGKENTFLHLPIVQNQVTNLTFGRENTPLNLPICQNQVPNLSFGRENASLNLPIGQDQVTNLTLERENTSLHLPISQHQVINLTLGRQTLPLHFPISQDQETSLSLGRDNTSVHLPIGQDQVTNLNIERESTSLNLPISQDQVTNLNIERESTSLNLPIGQHQVTNLTLEGENTSLALPVSQDQGTNLASGENTPAHLPDNQDNLYLERENLNTSVDASVNQSAVTKTVKKEKNSKLNRHRMRDTKTKEHSSCRFVQCTVCGKTFREGNLPEHMLRHTGERPHKCHLCEQKYRQRSALLRHLKKTHNIVTKREVLYGDKNAGQVTEEAVKRKGNKKGGRIASIYQCVFCDKKYMGKQEFQEHVRTHTGEVPYQCDFCHVRYRHLASIRRHLRIRELRGTCPVPHKNLIAEKVGKEGKIKISKHYQCRLCDQPFSIKANYWEHMKIHEGENQPELQCDLCELKFNSVQDLHQHMSSAHQKNPDPQEATAGSVDTNIVRKVEGNVTEISLSDNTIIVPGDSKDYSVIAVIDIVDFEDPNPNQNQSEILGTVSEHCVTDMKQL